MVKVVEEDENPVAEIDFIPTSTYVRGPRVVNEDKPEKRRKDNNEMPLSIKERYSKQKDHEKDERKPKQEEE